MLYAFAGFWPAAYPDPENPVDGKTKWQISWQGDLCHSFRGLISFLLILQRISLCPCCYILAEVESISF